MKYTNSCFNNATAIKTDGKLLLQITSDIESENINYGSKVTLTAEFNGELTENQRIIWVYSDTGERITEDTEDVTFSTDKSSITIKALEYRKVYACLIETIKSENIERDIIQAESKEFTVGAEFDPNSIETEIAINDENGKALDNKETQINNNQSVEIKIINWMDNWSDKYIIRWFVDDEEIIKDKGKSAVFLTGRNKDYKVKIRIESKDHPDILYKEIGPITVHVKADTPEPIITPQPPVTSSYKLPSFRERSAAYNTIVTVSIILNNVPSGAEVIIDGKPAQVSGNTYTAEIGQATSTKNVKVEVKYGTKVLDSTTLTVKVDTGFFAKLISFFSNFLFNMFKWKKATVNF